LQKKIHQIFSVIRINLITEEMQDKQVGDYWELELTQYCVYISVYKSPKSDLHVFYLWNHFYLTDLIACKPVGK
jgi:hypothetical protein